MARTTIDGLRVREPSPKRVPKSASGSASRTVKLAPSQTTRSSQPTKRRTNPQRQEALESINNIKRQNQPATSSFLDPVQTFDFDREQKFEAEPITTFEDEVSTGIETDWADLVSSVAPSNQLALPASLDDNPTDPADFFDTWDGKSKGESSGFLSDTLADEFDEEDEPKPTRRQKKYKPRKKRHLGRMVAISAICLLIIGGGVLYKWGDELISRLTGGASGFWDAIHSMVSDEIPFQTDASGRTNVLIFGTEGYDMAGNTAFGEHAGAQLTDSIMVASLNQETKDVALLSIPRDLKVGGCSSGKINEVFWCNNKDGNNEEAGALALSDKVGEVLGIDFQYYAHINWASLIDIIDTIGGITVTLDENIADYGYTGAVAQAGVPMEVNGEQALGLARARHGTMGGDFTRGNTQQKIVEAIVEKVMQNGVGVSEAFNLLNILGDNLRSNFSTDNIKAGLRVLSGFNIANIRQVPLVDYDTNTFYMTTATINEISYVVPAAGANDYSEIQRYVKAMFNNGGVLPDNPENAKILVLNASNIDGAATAERGRLLADGYELVDIDNAPDGSCYNNYCVFALSDSFPNTASNLTNRYGVGLGSSMDLPANIDAGEADFVIIIGPQSNPA